MHSSDDPCCQEQALKSSSNVSVMLPQHSRAVECEFTFFSSRMTSPSFALAAWGSKSEDKSVLQCEHQSLRDHLDDCSWDQFDDDSDDCDYDDGVSFEDSYLCCEKDNDTIHRYDDSFVDKDPDNMPRKVSLAQQQTCDVPCRVDSRRVYFCPEVVSNVSYYERAPLEDVKNLYYTAHELQKMIDDFVAQGGTKLLG